MVRLIDLDKKMKIAEREMMEVFSSEFGSREGAWLRISAMAGLDADGNIAPPRVSRAVKFVKSDVWRNGYSGLRVSPNINQE